MVTVIAREETDETLGHVTRGALQIQDRSPQSRNGRPVESCNAQFSRDRSVTARPVSACGLLCLPRSLKVSMMSDAMYEV